MLFKIINMSPMLNTMEYATPTQGNWSALAEPAASWKCALWLIEICCAQCVRRLHESRAAAHDGVALTLDENHERYSRIVKVEGHFRDLC